jgi:hypothetical protein
MGDIKQIAAERLRRVSVIRKRVIVAAAVTFAVLWSVLFFQLVAGHDPALSKQTAQTTDATSAGSTTASSGIATTSSGATTTGSGSSTSGATTPVTTSQS